MTKAAMAPAKPGRGELKQITAVFIDVVGFSDIASTADPEDLQSWLEDYYEQSRTIVEDHDGEVTEYLGDGVVALFGLEKADELAAAKAVNAAMKAVREINAAYQGDVHVKLRAGVATGEVAVRAANRNDSLPRATGMVTTLAQRIQEMAEPGAVMISEATSRLLRGTISLQEVPNQRLKGFADAQTLFLPLQSVRQEQSDEVHSFVGRASELARVGASDQPCLIIGQAGIGKTALARHLAKSAGNVAVFAADGVHTRASYQPFQNWIMQQTGGPLPEFTDIKSRFADLSGDAQRALALVLGLPEGQRLLAEQTNVALKALIENSLCEAIRSVQEGGMLVFEDLHWLDNASFSVLVSILQSPEMAAYRVLMTSREDTKIGRYLGDLSVNMVPLDPLGRSDAAGILNALSHGEVTQAERDELIERSGGVPLFLVQLFNRSQSGADEGDQIPGSLMDLLAQQIDATGPSKPVLQCAAVIGRHFDTEMLRAIATEHEPLDTHLDKACMRGVLEADGKDGYSFSHALLHQAAYQGLLRRTRVDYHGKIAAHLQEYHSDAVRRNPALLTDHLSLAQQHVPAIQNYLTVSQWALFQGAFADAEAHILAALTQCAEAPADVDVSDLEIACYTALGSIRMQTLGFTAPPVKEAFEAVEKLATAQHKYSAANGPAMYGSFSNAIIAADKAGSRTFCDFLTETADNLSDEETNHEVRLAALGTSVCLEFYSGNFQAQFADFDRLRGIYDIGKHGAMIANYGMDTFAAAQMFEPVGRAICGQTHLVPALLAETDAHQDLLNIPVMLPYAQIWGAVPMFYAGNHTEALDRLTSGIKTATSQTALFWQSTGTVWLHVMDPSQHASEEGLAQFDQALKMQEAIGSNIGLPYFRAHYAMALAERGQTEEAYQVSQLATRQNEENGLLCWYAEVLRLHASVCLKFGRRDDASRALIQSVSVAEKQQAHLWALRARLDQFAAGLTSKETLAATLYAFPAEATPPEVVTARKLLDAG